MRADLSSPFNPSNINNTINPNGSEGRQSTLASSTKNHKYGKEFTESIDGGQI